MGKKKDSKQMIPHTWYKCLTHKVNYPIGETCPRCHKDLKQRQEEALKVNWEDVIPLEHKLDFLKYEQLYCRDEEHELYTYSGSDINIKEHLQTAVLEKRAKFLQLFITIIKGDNDVYQTDGGDR